MDTPKYTYYPRGRNWKVYDIDGNYISTHPSKEAAKKEVNRLNKK